jgi:BASS family bile acid:Na+ symporter
MQVIGFALTASVFLGVLAVGMRVVPGDLHYLLGKPSQLVRSLVVMNVLGPIIAVMVCRTFSLHGAVIVALVTLSIAPVGALFSQAMLPLVGSARASYARGLFFVSTLLSVILTPLAVEVINVLFGADVHVNPLAVAQVVLGSVLGISSADQMKTTARCSPSRRCRGIPAWRWPSQVSQVSRSHRSGCCLQWW